MKEWKELLKRFESRTESAIIKYIFDTWIPYKEMFASACTDRITHFGHTVISRGESAHRMLKHYMPNSINNFLSCWEKLYLAIGNNHAEYDVSRKRQQMRIRDYAQPTPQEIIFQTINLKISHFALNKISEQLNLVRQPQKSKQVNCTGFFNTVWGLPFSHKLRLYLDQEQDQDLQLTDIHSHWHLANPYN